MEAEEVCVGEKFVCSCWYLACVDEVEMAVNVVVDVDVVEVNKGGKDVN